MLSGSVADRRRARPSAAATAVVTVDARTAAGRSRSRSSTAPARPTRRVATFDEVVEAARERVRATSSTPWHPGATAATPAAELAAYVLWSATVRPAGFVTRPAGADVQALDGQGLELGPLLQRPRPGPRLPRAGLGPVPAALRPPGRDRRPARLGHPLRGPLQLRQTAHPRLGPAASCADGCPSRSTAPNSTATYDRLARWTDFWLDRPPAPRRTPCPTTSTATTAAGTTPPPSTPSAWSSPPTSPPSSSSSCANSPTSPPSWARPDDAGGGREPPSRPQAALLDQLWDGDRFVARGRRHRRHLEQRQPARPDAHRAGRRTCPPSVARRAGRPDRGPPDRARPGHRAAHLAALPRRRLLARPDLGPRHRPRSRTACAAPGTTGSPTTISARFRALCETHGFAENFDALTGTGLRDRAYTWTASSYLLAADHVRRS